MTQLEMTALRVKRQQERLYQEKELTALEGVEPITVRPTTVGLIENLLIHCEYNTGPVLADALQEDGYDDTEALADLRDRNRLDENWPVTFTKLWLILNKNAKINRKERQQLDQLEVQCGMVTGRLPSSLLKPRKRASGRVRTLETGISEKSISTTPRQ